MRAVLDPNVIVSAVLPKDGTPAKLLQAWLLGSYELVVSPKLLAELRRVLAYPKITKRVTPQDADELLNLLSRQAQLLDDPLRPPRIMSSDPDDDYLISLAEGAQAVIVSGDAHLKALGDQIPVFTPAAFMAMLVSDSN